MPHSGRAWTIRARRFVSAFVVFGALFVPVAWWVFSSSLMHAVAYWFVCTVSFGAIFAWEDRTRLDGLFRKLPWWRD
jgi:hypothetical protein